MTLSKDEREYLADVIEQAEALGHIFDKPKGNSEDSEEPKGNLDNARQRLARSIGQPKRLLNLLRKCETTFGCHSDEFHACLDYVGTQWRQHPGGYPAIWDPFADREVIAELKRWRDLAVSAGGLSKGTEQEGDGENNYSSVQLQENAYTILCALADSPTRLKLEDLRHCTKPPMDRKTVRKHLNTLCDAGLAEYDPKSKQGAAITSGGRQALEHKS